MTDSSTTLSTIRQYTIRVNGQDFAVNDVPVQTTLLDFLRERGLTGAKEGCAEGECGACMVAMVVGDGAQAAYRAVNSCLLLAVASVDRELYTVEGLKQNGQLAEAQVAMAAAGGSQCGYCTPGFVVSLFAEQYRRDRTGPCDPHALGGNLCRCTGYRPIRDAVTSIGPPPEGYFLERLSKPARPLNAVDYSAGGVRLERLGNLAECLSILSQSPKAKLIAGGTDLTVESNLRGRRWEHLVSLEGIGELREFTRGPNTVRIGAGLPLSEIGHLWTDAPPVVSAWLGLFASPQIRNRATLGGNLATASPIGDSAPMLMALNAQVHVTSTRGSRTLPLSTFFTGYRQTQLEEDELIQAIEIPQPSPGFLRFFKASKRRMDDISTAAGGLAISVDADDIVTQAIFAFGGVAASPVRVAAAEEVALGKPWNLETIAQIAKELDRALNPLDDHRGSAAYRKAMVRNFVAKFYQEWTECRGMTLVPHESAVAHVTGEAIYTDDLCSRYPNLLHAWPVLAPHAHARLLSLSVAEARQSPGVVHILTAEDVPGENDTGSNRHDEPLFPTEVMYHSQPVAWVLGETLEAARAAALLVSATYETLPAILTIDEAIAAESFLNDQLRIVRGDPSVIGYSALRFQGELRIGGQEHFYLETQCAIASVDALGGILVESSTQHPAETQEIVSRVLGIPWNQVTVECLRMGGAFGGKEVQANPFAAVAALGAWKTRRPVRVRLPRMLDMALTGKRHPFYARYEAGFTREGQLEGVRIALYSDGGWSLDLSGPVISRAMFHADNAYLLPNCDITGRICLTHKTSQTAFRGFGGPQGMIVIEEVMDQAARRLGLLPEAVRERNFYREGDVSHYGQLVKEPGRIHTIWQRLKATSSFDERRLQVRAFNASHAHKRRGIAITPMKFGISFTATFMNQAGALVIVYRDGSVQVNHGGGEMGQGLHTKIRQIAAVGLGIEPSSIRIMPTNTGKVPNTSATAASASTDLNGAAVLEACAQLKLRLAPVAAGLLGCAEAEISFRGGEIHGPGGSVAFSSVVAAAYRQRIPLFAQGFYRTPGLQYDPVTLSGKPFHYYAWGAAVSEVELDLFTGDCRVLRVDLLEDAGSSFSPIIDRGQIEGGFMQGLGWLTIEELLWDSKGRLATAGASTYKLPSWSELPEIFNVELLENAADTDVVLGSKAVGEPPLMLAFSVREAIRDAIASCGATAPVMIDSPATPERIFFAIERAKAGAIQ